MAKISSFAIQIAGLVFLLWFVQSIKSVISIAALLVFAAVYLFGVRFITTWVQSALGKSTD